MKSNKYFLCALFLSGINLLVFAQIEDTAEGSAIKKWNYFTFLNYRTLSGYRTYAQQQQLTGYGKIACQVSKKTSFSLEYSLLRNKIKMPGGLINHQFETDSKASVRSRNWLISPWNVVTASMDHHINKNAFLHIKSPFLSGERSLVWFNKLPNEPNLINPLTGQYADKEIVKEPMKSVATEIRLLQQYNWGKMKSILATGNSFATAKFNRKEEAPVTNKSDFDLTTTGEYEENFRFSTSNIDAFVEKSLQVNDRFSITPGIRFESLASEAESEYEVNGVEKETEQYPGPGIIPSTGRSIYVGAGYNLLS